VGSGEPRLYTLRLRFPEPAPWAVSFMDLTGSFHDLGLRTVRPPPMPAQRGFFAAALEMVLAAWGRAGL
jgi:hypothetical protein